MFKHIDAKWFFLSLAVGLFIVYCSTPTPEVIIKYPTPENADDLIFEDDSDNCYKFKTQEVKCPTKNKINQIPIQRKNM
jgi:hypothetical protein|tara:strand:+ start:5065 stop:5301 length:237 start_codon:yes stop_codon:yes gene_type:complete